MLKNVSPKLIENVKDLKIALNELTVHDLNVYSMVEIYYKVAHKLNEVINELSRFEGVLSEEVIKQNEKLIYLLGEGLEHEVIENIDRLIENNFFENIINEKIFSDLNNKIDSFKTEIDSQLEHKVNKVELETQIKRIDNFVSLESGSTTGDAELIDARISYDGVQYDNLGESIRRQINELKNGYLNENSITIDKLSNVYYDTNFKKVICNTTTNFSAFSISVDKTIPATSTISVNTTILSKSKDINIMVNLQKQGDETTYPSNKILVKKGIRTCCDFNINVNIEENKIIYLYFIIESTNLEENKIEIINPILTSNNKEMDIYNKGFSVVQNCTLTKKEEFYSGLGKYSNFNNKKILFFGDSITDTSWGNMYPYFIEKITGVKNINYAVASSGYAMNAYYPHSIWGKEKRTVYDMVTRAYEKANNEVDLIVVSAGTNDWDFNVPLGQFEDIFKEEMEKPTLYFGVAKVIKNIFNLYPYTPIQILSPLPRNQANVNQHTLKNGKSLVDFSNAIKDVCEYYSIPYLNSMYNSNMKLNNKTNIDIYTTDGLHPTEFFSERYAKIVADEISKWL